MGHLELSENRNFLTPESRITKASTSLKRKLTFIAQSERKPIGFFFKVKI